MVGVNMAWIIASGRLRTTRVEYAKAKEAISEFSGDK